LFVSLLGGAYAQEANVRFTGVVTANFGLPGIAIGDILTGRSRSIAT
jgi:hypothetical protein